MAQSLPSQSEERKPAGERTVGRSVCFRPIADIATVAIGVHSPAMKQTGILALAATLFLNVADAQAHGQAPPKVGEAYEITKSYETAEQTSDGSSSSSSRGHDALLERVVGVREDGLELEYDLPRDASAEDRARYWQFPVRVFRPSSGPMQLLNRAALEARLDDWLKAAGWTRAVCGQWIFTWNAFRIECDPQSVIETLEAVDLRFPELREGASYEVAEASGPGTVARISAGPNSAIYTVTMQVDPEAVRVSRAESDVAVGQILQKPVTLEAALRERAKEQVTGRITVTFELDAAGNLRRRTKVTELKTQLADGQARTTTAKETVERRLVPAVAAHR